MRFVSQRSVASLYTLVVAGVTTLVSATASAQAFNYPSFQTPTASTRDYTGAISGGNGTSAIFQWREGAGRGIHWQLDAGIADPNGRADPLFFVGGTYANELLRASGEQPLDLMLTVGIGGAFGGNVRLLRIPIGLSVGHTFELDQGMAITPYVHPRLSADICGDCGRDQSTLSLNFDLGAFFQVTRQFGVKAAVSFSGSRIVGEEETIGVGFVWTPGTLRR